MREMEPQQLEEFNKMKDIFYLRMADELLNQLTVVSTCVQTADMDYRKACENYQSAHESLRVAQAEVMRMAEKIKAALHDAANANA